MPKKGNPALVSIAAAGSVLLASSCCLPILPFVMAAGFAGSSAFLSVARPYLLCLSVLFIACGFYQAWREKQCRRRPSVIGAVLLCVSALFVASSIFFPQALANVFAGSSQAPSGQPELRSLNAGNVTEIRDAFNAAKDSVRVLLFFSPT